MQKENYHHGTLKEEMIQKGLILINNEGIKGFSLRKVAAMCGVSHTAPYKHFKNKEELMEAISNRVLKSFSECLMKAVETAKNEQTGMADVGKAYVKFMLDNKEYFRFIFFSECKVNVKLKANDFIYKPGNPFEVFCSGATAYLEHFIKDKTEINCIILSMWSIVHGISTLVIHETFEYEGDYEELVERMLRVQPR
ncbi:MAG: regulatory protein TetR [Clostridia bacterium]|nr:regulatory protein TetR [Clostridia bacterium]